VKSLLPLQTGSLVSQMPPRVNNDHTILTGNCNMNVEDVYTKINKLVAEAVVLIAVLGCSEHRS
jgi:hypothetical protein